MDYQEIERIVCDTILKMQTSSVIRLNTAKKLIELVENEATRIGVKAVVAVSDAAGRPIAVHSMDGAYIGSFDVAINKTFTAIAFQMPTSRLATLAAPGGELYGIQNTNEGKIVIFGGGEPLYIGENLIGALGVSGGTAEQDTYLGEYGKNRLKEVMTWN